MQEHVADESRGPYFPFDRREPYPKRLKVDFRRLPRKTLLTYTAHHDLHVRPDSTHEELAIAAARHFAAWRVNEESIMASFCANIAASSLGTARGIGEDLVAADRKRKRMDTLDVVPLSPEGGPVNPAPISTSPPRRQRSHAGSASASAGGGGGGSHTSGSRGGSRGDAATSNSRYGGGAQPTRHRSARGAADRERDRGGGGRSGRDAVAEFATNEQVGAYVARADQQPGSPPRAWILARVVREKSRGRVELHDEDDASHVFELPSAEIVHLEDFSDDLQKRDKVLAVFPDTTMFYCATIAKNSPRLDGNTKVMLVYFEDDEDETGKTRYRRVPVEHVILDNEKDQRGGAGGGGGGGGSGKRSGASSRRSGQGNSNSSSRATGGSRSRSISPRLKDYGGGGTAAGYQGGSGSVASRGSGGGSANAGGGGGRSGGKEPGKKAGTTYADMIAHALSKVSGGRGAFTEICDIIEAEFTDVLNWKLESDIRKTPVWKSSVRKILFSNSRFAHCSTTPEQGHVFTMARLKK